MHNIEVQNKDFKKYPEWVLKAQDIGGYIEVFNSFYADYPNSALEQFEAMERWYYSYFGRNKYKSFESFSVNRKRYLNKRAKENGFI